VVSGNIGEIVKLVQVMLVWWAQYCGNCETGASDVTVVIGNIGEIGKWCK